MSVEEQIMSKDKYPSIFSKSSGDYCVYYPSNIFHSTRSFENRGIFSDIRQFQEGNIQSRDTFKPIARKRKYLMDYKLKYFNLTVSCVQYQKIFGDCQLGFYMFE